MLAVGTSWVVYFSSLSSLGDDPIYIYNRSQRAVKSKTTTLTSAAVGFPWKNLQSTLVISKSKGSFERLRDIRTSTYQICLVGWLVGLGFNGPLRQYFSLYRAVSQREGERGKNG